MKLITILFLILTAGYTFLMWRMFYAGLHTHLCPYMIGGVWIAWAMTGIAVKIGDETPNPKKSNHGNR